jgi:wyosine [tRNA(Phe)-imidazoG37] synthetase (radical SAM superfamily)
MEKTKYEHLYGPVPSRRLGRSLGIDMAPYKTCCFDCVYCQLGRTTNHTMRLAEYVPTGEVLAEVEAWLERDGGADYLTFSASGEPTLNSALGAAIAGVKAMTDIPVALLTNGALLWMDCVREAALLADLLIPSLDAATPGTLQAVNRPCDGLTLERIVRGIQRTVAEFEGPTWLEVMLVKGVNDSEGELRAIRAAVEEIKPTEVQINTVVRPVPGGAAERLGDEELARARDLLGPRARVIPSAWEHGAPERSAASEEDVLRLVSYRPCTLRDIARGLAMHPNEIIKYVDHLLADGAIGSKAIEGETYYTRADRET